MQALVNVPIVFGIRTTMNVNAQSGVPYTITTGFDDNRDGVLNDRPIGVGRNTARGAATWNMNLRVSKVIGLGGATAAGPAGGEGVVTGVDVVRPHLEPGHRETFGAERGHQPGRDGGLPVPGARGGDHDSRDGARPCVFGAPRGVRGGLSPLRRKDHHSIPR